MEKKCIGIDVGGTTVKLGLFEADGALIRKWEVPTRKEEGGVHILPDVAASVRAVLEEERLSLSDVAGAGMGIPGPVLEDGYVEVCVNLGWRDMNPQQILSGLLDNLPICSGNDANVAAMGEMAGRRQRLQRYCDGNAWDRRRGRCDFKSEDCFRKAWTGRRDRAYPHPRE